MSIHEEQHYSPEIVSYPSISSGYVDYGPPNPPTKCIRYGKHGQYRKRVETELHEALFSLGTKNRTANISDGELAMQFAAEVGYLAGTGSYYLGRAGHSLCELIKMVFN